MGNNNDEMLSLIGALLGEDDNAPEEEVASKPEPKKRGRVAASDEEKASSKIKRISRKEKESVDPQSEYAKTVGLDEDATIVTEDGSSLTVLGLSKVSDEIFKSVVTVPRNELKFLIDSYYQTQEYRKSTDNQIRSIQQGVDGEGIDETPSMLRWLASNLYNQEKELKKAIEFWASGNKVCQWAMDTIGVGPIIAAGFMAYFDITNKQYAGQFWSYAGLNDNNNPWLGKEGSKDILTQLKEHLTSVNSERLDISSINDNKTYDGHLKKFVKKTERQTMIDTLVDLGSGVAFDSTRMGEIKEIFNDETFALLAKDVATIGCNEFLYLLDYYYDTKMVNNEIIDFVAETTHRSRSTIVKGVTDDEGNQTMKKLTSYLPIPPYSRGLKTLCWKLSDSFVKRSGNPESLYGRLYKERKAYEMANNEAGMYKGEAEKALNSKNWSNKESDAYKCYSIGKLPPAHIDARARRWTVKLFVSHLFEAMYIDAHGTMPPEPYVLAYNNLHHDYIAPEVPYDKYFTYTKK